MVFVHAVIAGIVLAGGGARRMGGGDKGLLPLDGRPMLAHVTDRLRPQVVRLAINANGDAARFAGFGLPVIADAPGPAAGPLAGVLAGMRWAAGFPFLATAACDTPFLPMDMVRRLGEALKDHDVAVAASGGRTHPTAALWRTDLADALAADLAAGRAAGVHRWLAGRRVVEVAFTGDPDPFTNVNTPDDLATAAGLLHRTGV